MCLVSTIQMWCTKMISKNRAISNIFAIVLILLLFTTLIAFRSPLAASTIPNSIHQTTYDSKNSNFIAHNSEVLNILYPRNSFPEFVIPNQPFKVVVNVTGTPTEWNISIVSIRGAALLTIINTTSDNTVWTLWCSVDSDTFGLYNLSVSAKIGDTVYQDVEPRAVNLIREFPSTFTFIVINDFRVSDKHPERATALIEAINQINMLHPTFVLVIGDLINSGFWEDETESDTAKQYREFYNILQKLEVPTFVICGNHEYYNHGIKYYDEYFGYWPNQKADEQYHNYTFVFGDSVFVFVDTGEGSRAVLLKDSQIQWVESQFQKYQDKRLKFLVLHVPVFDGTGDDRGLSDVSKYKITDIVDTYNVTLVLEGHTHIDKKTVYHDHVYLETTAIGAPARTPSGVPNYVAHWGYRIIKVENNTITRYAYGEDPFGYMSYPVYVDENGVPTSYIATPSFNVTYKFNDIWHYYNVAHVRNNLNESKTVWIKFVFPQLTSGMTINVENSLKTEVYSFNDKTYVYALVNMTPGDTIVRAEITPTPSAPEISNLTHEVYSNESGSYLFVRATVNDNYGLLRVSLVYSYNNMTKVVNMHLENNSFVGTTEVFNESVSLSFYIIAINIYGVNSTTHTYTTQIQVKAPQQGGFPLLYETMIGGAIAVSVIIIVVVFFIKRRKTRTS